MLNFHKIKFLCMENDRDPPALVFEKKYIKMLIIYLNLQRKNIYFLETVSPWFPNY